jgi:probable HAF family extracellular repeat protein
MKISVMVRCLLLGLLGSLQVTHANPITYTYTPISVPGSSSTSARAINNAGQIVGYYRDSAGEHGFLYSTGTYTTIDVPGGISTELLGVNNVGQIVGTYRDSSNNLRLFLDDNSVFTTIDVPGGLDIYVTFLGAGINDAGQIVSTAFSQRAFRYDHGQFFFIPPVYGIAGGNFAAGINNAGQIAMEESDGGDGYAYVYSNGVSTRLAILFSDSDARGISNAGDVVGRYESRNRFGSFLYSGGVVTLFDESSSPDFYFIFGINDAGQLIGAGGNGLRNAVLATPTTIPEPASLLLFTPGLAGLGLVIRRKRQNGLNC